MVDVKQFVPVLLVIMGVILQFVVRAKKAKSELVYLGWAVGLCSLVYVLTNVPFVDSWNIATVKWLVWLGDPVEGAVMKIIAGTGATSIVANLAVSVAKADPAAAVIPVTDSK